MNKDYNTIKSNRYVWVDLLSHKQIEVAIALFEDYILDLENFKSNISTSNDKSISVSDIDYEIYISKNFFLSKTEEIADKYYNDEDFSNAAIYYYSNLKYDGSSKDIIEKYINCVEKIDNNANAIDFLINIAEKYNNIKIFKSIAELFAKNKDYNNAIIYLKKYIDNQTEIISADEYNLLGCYYNCRFSNISADINDAILGLESFKKASDMVPDCKVFAKNVTIMAGKVGDIKCGEKYWKRCFKIGDLSNDDKFDYAAFCLNKGNLKEFYKYFEYRFDKENNKTDFPVINKPKWDGNTDISNAKLLIYYEQGYGDTFLMYGYMPRLLKLAKKVIFIPHEATYSLLKDNDCGIEILQEYKYKDISSIDFDYYIPSMSILSTLKINKRNISVGAGYIKANKELVKDYKKRYFNNKKLKIGISVGGNTNGDLSRDIPIIELLPLNDLENVELYMITKGMDDNKLDIFNKNKIHNLGNVFADFSHTAAAIENCDLMITSDNCILNLAGAMGKRTYGIFNNPNQFRWFDLSGEDTIWYKTVKPFVNDGYNMWNTSINKVINEIKNKDLLY